MNTIHRISTLLFALSISVGAGIAQAAPAGAGQHGAIVRDAASVRTIVVKPDTKWVNVTNGEIVTFDVAGQRFTYHFQAWPNINSLPMSAIAPQELNVAGIRVYVAQPVEG